MTDLHHQRLTAPDSRPDRAMFLLHGIYGAGRNWNRVAKALVERRPDWAVIPVDLRGHGRSETGQPPHTLAACVDDLEQLAASLEGDVAAILGHSFGGKVALLLGDRPSVGIESVFVVDSTPDARPPGGSAWGMLQVLRDSPGPFPDRATGIAAVEAAGYANAVAQWMSTNLVPDGAGGMRWRLDPDQMEELLLDFFHTDAWPALEAAVGPEIHLLRATESSILTEEARDHAATLGTAAGRVHLHDVEGGHWLNADNPDAVVELLARYLPD